MATVDMVSPEGNPEVINVNNVQAKLAEGYVLRDDAWKAQQEAIAAQKYQEWLADPATADERFQMLRMARDGKIAATDYLMTVDYPLDDEKRALVGIYRQALRDLPAQDGAPWDGGGELTPWPVMPNAASII